MLWGIEGESQVWMEGWVLHRCSACQRPIMWLHNTDTNTYSMVYPRGVVGDAPRPDMPSDVQAIYEEARQVAAVSQRSAAALLRLGLQILVDHLEPESGQINAKIGRLVKRGLNPHIQQAMDVLRVVGNNAVHPGQIDVEEDPSLVTGLFRLVNVVVDQMISVPEHAEALFNALPESAREQVAKRDGT